MIAVLGFRLPEDRLVGWDTGAYAVPDTYVDAATQAGMLLVTLPDDARPGALESFDGVLLLGGGDVDPKLYGDDADPETYEVDAARDDMEIDLVKEADRAGVPTLAICRGAQVVNVAFGGTLHQHLPGLDGLIPHGIPRGGEPATHDVTVAPGSRLAAACGSETLSCESHHHQGIDRVGEGLIPVAWSEDGLVEAVERPGGWMVAVQWHPEDTAGEDPAQQALFDAFAREAGARG